MTAELRCQRRRGAARGHPHRQLRRAHRRRAPAGAARHVLHRHLHGRARRDSLRLLVQVVALLLLLLLLLLPPPRPPLLLSPPSSSRQPTPAGSGKKGSLTAIFFQRFFVKFSLLSFESPQLHPASPPPTPLPSFDFTLARSFARPQGL